MPHLLNDELHSALNRYLAARKSGRSYSEPLNSALCAMNKQAPSSIAEADSVISATAYLWRWERESWQRKQPWWKRKSPGQGDDRTLLLNDPELAFLFIFHRNGHLRQAALDQISAPIPNAFLVAALAWRLNDWVEEVRASALACAERSLPQTNGEVIADFLLATFRQQNSWRRWSEDGRETLNKAIGRADVINQIVSRMLTGNQGPLPSLLSHLLRYEWIDWHLARIAKSANNPGLRAIALRCLVNGTAKYTEGTVWRWIDKPMGLGKREPKIMERPLNVESNAPVLVKAGIADKSAVVRRVALDGVIGRKLYDVLAKADLQRCSDDPSASVRSRAEYILKKVETH